MPTVILNIDELAAFFTGVTLTEQYTPLNSFGLQFGEDDIMVCDSCNGIEHPNEMYVAEPVTATTDGRHICNPCHRDATMPERHCTGCNTRLTHQLRPVFATAVVGGAEQEVEICVNCNSSRRYHSSYERCSHCSRYESPGNFVAAEGQLVCASCLEREYTYCASCEEHHRANRSYGDDYNLPRPKIESVTVAEIMNVIDTEHLSLKADLVTTEG